MVLSERKVFTRPATQQCYNGYISEATI